MTKLDLCSAGFQICGALDQGRAAMPCGSEAIVASEASLYSWGSGSVVNPPPQEGPLTFYLQKTTEFINFHTLKGKYFTVIIRDKRN